MKLLHLTRDYPPGSAGGMSTAVGGLVRGTASLGWTHAVISFDAWRPKGQKAAAELVGGVLRVRGRPGPEIAAFADVQTPDVTLIHDPTIFDAVGPLPGRTACVVHVDHEQLARVRGLSTAPRSVSLMRQALSDADLVLAPSQAVVDRLMERGVRTPVRKAGFGVDPCPDPRTTAGDRIVYVGRFDTAKGTDVLLEAVGDRSRLTLAGGLPHNPRAEARWVEKWPDADWRGWLSPDERDRLLRSAAVLAVPSLEETLGLVALEAMRLGVPVVASDVGGLGEIVSGGGELVPAGDVDAWRSALQGLLDDPERRRRLGAEAHRWVHAHHVWPVLLDEWIAALQG
jgi:glycogen synthase